MKQKRNNQAGFAAIELILSVVIVLLILFVGYYVVHSQKQVNRTLNTSVQNSQSVAKPSAAGSNAGLFKFTNLGVQFDLPSLLDGFHYYSQTFNDGLKGGYISTDAIQNAIKECTKGQTEDTIGLSFAGLGKGTGQFSPDQPGEARLLKQFSTSFIDISYPNGNSPCYPNQTAMDNLQSQEAAAKSAFLAAFTATAVESK